MTTQREEDIKLVCDHQLEWHSVPKGHPEIEPCNCNYCQAARRLMENIK